MGPSTADTGKDQGGRKGDQQRRRSKSAERSPFDEYSETAKKAAMRQQERFEADMGSRLKCVFKLQHIDAELQAAQRQAATSFTGRIESADQQRRDQERTAYEEYLEELGSDGDDREKRFYAASLKLLRQQLDAAHQQQLGYRDAQDEYLTAVREAEASAQEKAWQEAAELLKQLFEVEG